MVDNWVDAVMIELNTATVELITSRFTALRGQLRLYFCSDLLSRM